jgi:hypothetical protein
LFRRLEDTRRHASQGVLCAKQLFKVEATAGRFYKVLSTTPHFTTVSPLCSSSSLTQAFSCPDLRQLCTMTIQFSPGCNIAPNQRGELQLWIEKKVDRDTDFYIAVVSQVASKYVMMRANWHKSTTGSDKEEHLTGNVIIVRIKPIRTAAFSISHSTRIMRRWVRPTSTEMDRSQCTASMKISHSNVQLLAL